MVSYHLNSLFGYVHWNSKGSCNHVHFSMTQSIFCWYSKYHHNRMYHNLIPPNSSAVCQWLPDILSIHYSQLPSRERGLHQHAHRAFKTSTKVHNWHFSLCVVQLSGLSPDCSCSIKVCCASKSTDWDCLLSHHVRAQRSFLTGWRPIATWYSNQCKDSTWLSPE